LVLGDLRTVISEDEPPFAETALTTPVVALPDFCPRDDLESVNESTMIERRTVELPKNCGDMRLCRM
jgi:hypothetical protein